MLINQELGQAVNQELTSRSHTLQALYSIIHMHPSRAHDATPTVEVLPEHNSDPREYVETYPWADSFSDREKAAVLSTPIHEDQSPHQIPFPAEIEANQPKVLSTPQADSQGADILYQKPADIIRDLNIPQGVIDRIPDFLGDAKEADGNGVKWHDKYGGNYVRIMKGDPESEFAAQQQDYVRVNSGGNVIGRDGKPIPETVENPKPGDMEEAHIPKDEYDKWKEWDKP